MAGGRGFEPRLTESESAVLPLYDPPASVGYGPKLGSEGALSTGDRAHCQNYRAGCNTFINPDRNISARVAERHAAGPYQRRAN